MICGRIQAQAGTDTIYDYTSCYYPEGIDPTSIFFFNRDAIETVYYRGYEDTDEPDFPFDSAGGSFRCVPCQEFQRENDFIQGRIAAGKRRSQ